MPATLYAIPASHPCAAVERALQLKAMPYRRVELIPVAHRVVQLARFGAGTVPALELEDRERLVGSRPIFDALERRRPQPPLFPAGEAERMGVERADEWGDQVLQPLVRRVVWAALKRAPSALMSYAEGARLPVPRPLARLAAPLTARAAARLCGADDLSVRADLIHLDGHLERIADWVRDGTLGGAQPNAADLQVGAGIALLATLRDVAPRLEGSPAARLATRWYPDYPGCTPAGALPPDWLETRSGGPANRT